MALRTEQEIRERITHLQAREAGEKRQYVQVAIGQQIIALTWALGEPTILDEMEDA